ncbi:MAG: LarC family nickel insertion protein, partial [Nitrospirae bacterium]
GLGLEGWALEVRRTTRGGVACTHARVTCTGAAPRRRLADGLAVVAAADLPQPVRDRARAVLTRLAEAEAAVHGVAVERVHLHEVGMVDALVDIVGGCWCLHALGVERLTHGPVALGDGWVACAHGRLPVPVPAVERLLAGRPVRRGLPGLGAVGELTTPTGAALLATLAQPLPEGSVHTVTRTGYGAGDRDPEGFPNCLRLHLLAPEGAGEPLVELVADLDDALPEWLPEVAAAAREAGAVDVTWAPLTTKHGRPGVRLTALAPEAAAETVARALLRHTTSFGVRHHPVRRTTLARRHVTVATPYGPVRVKEGWLGGERLQATPEHADCAERAREAGVPVREVYRAALAAVPPAGEAP